MIIKDNNLIINVEENNFDKIIKQTKKILKLCDENNLILKINYNNKNIEKEDNEELFNILCAINIKNIEERYSFIYDTVCNYIDKKYLECNYCDFKDNVCIFFRNNPKISHPDGCCYNSERDNECIHLKNHRCNIKSISCKLYSCEYLRKRKVNFKMKDIPLLKYFFNLKQKYFIKYSFFKPKSYVMYKLLENK
jgi:hypothetical protein